MHDLWFSGRWLQEQLVTKGSRWVYRGKEWLPLFCISLKIRKFRGINGRKGTSTVPIYLMTPWPKPWVYHGVCDDDDTQGHSFFDSLWCFIRRPLRKISPQYFKCYHGQKWFKNFMHFMLVYARPIYGGMNSLQFKTAETRDMYIIGRTYSLCVLISCSTRIGHWVASCYNISNTWGRSDGISGKVYLC